MAEENKQAAATPPAENGKQAAEKTFTQEEVNRIVTERLARERSKSEPPEVDEREQQLSARENKLSCREYITESKYPEELLEIFDTSNVQLFQEKVEKLLKAFPDIIPNSKQPVMFTKSTGGMHGSNDSGVDTKLRNIFFPNQN